MSDTRTTIPMHPPSDPNGRAERDGYRAGFYPGFVRRLAVRAREAETLLYEQSPEKPFYLPPGWTRPWATSTLEFQRPDGRRLVLQIDDPHQQIDRIEVHFKGDPTIRRTEGGGVTAMSGGEPAPVDDGAIVLVCEDGPVLCPPMCPLT